MRLTEEQISIAHTNYRKAKGGYKKAGFGECGFNLWPKNPELLEQFMKEQEQEQKQSV